MTDHEWALMNGTLERFLAQATADDYPSVESQTLTSSRDQGGSGGSWARLVTALVVVVMAVLLIAAVFTVRAGNSTREESRAALVERVVALQASVGRLQEEVAARSARIESLRTEVEGADDNAAGEQQRSELSQAAGATELMGPGLTITIDDAPDAEAGSLNRVLDRDIQDIVNALWAMDAAGVAVNDQRLTATSAIRGAGEAILVNYRPLQRPYVISAVGPRSSEGSTGLQDLLDTLGAEYGLVHRIEVGDVALPGGQVHLPASAGIAVAPASSEEIP